MNTVKRTKRPETRRKPKMTNEQLLAFLSTSFHKTNLTVEHNMTVDFNQVEISLIIELIEKSWIENGRGVEEMETAFDKLIEAEDKYDE